MKQKALLSLLAVLFYAIGWAQNRPITGRVVKEGTSEPLSGVTVAVKGSQVSTTTRDDGNYTISVPAGNVTLVFSYVGHTTREVPVGNQSTIDVTLVQASSTTLDDVVVVGYTTVRRRDLTGSVSSTSARELKDIPLNTAAEALTGRLAGVQVITSEGRPGADILVRVRGGGSITQDNSPLYIVDGIQVENALSVLSPQEIQSIDVLKDAASTAIYGARGANGVVIITTKGGRAQKTQVTYNGYAGVRKITNTLDVLDPYEFAKFQYQIYNYNTSEDVRRSFVRQYGRFEDLDLYKEMPSVNWQDRVFGREAFSQTHVLGVTGGTAATTFSLNLNHSDEEGIMLNSGFTRSLASFKFDHKISSKFRTGITTRYSRQQVEGVGTSNTGTQSTNRLRNAVRYLPYLGTSADMNENLWDPFYADQTNLISPVLLANQELRDDFRNDIIVNGYLSWEIIKNLTFRTQAGVTAIDRRINAFSGPVTSIARQNKDMPVADITRNESVSITNSNTLNYKTTFGSDHNFDFLLGQEIYQLNSNTQFVRTKYLPVDITPEQAFAGIQKASAPDNLLQDAPTTSEYANRLFSLFGRVNYSYDKKYLLTLTARRDGSSLFAPENRYGVFPSVAGAWSISEEAFMEDVDFVRNLKLRLSWGTSGNNRIEADLWKTMFTASGTNGYAFGEAVVPGFAPASLGNMNLKWETTIARNIGLDFSLFRNRLNATIDLYQNNTKDLLLDRVITPTSGYPSQQQNTGKTQNRGIEIQLNGDIVRSKDFFWNASFNWAMNRNKIVSLGLDPSGQPLQSYLVESGWISSSYQDFIVQVGAPIGQFYGYVTDGFYTVNDFIYDATAQTYTLKPGVANTKEVALGNRDPQPGDLKLKKLVDNGTMMVGADDRTILGTAQPKFTGGFNQQFSYKGFDASLFMNFAVGGKVYNANKIEFTTQYLYRDNNMLAEVANGWKWFNDQGVRVYDPAELEKLNANTTFWNPPLGQYFLHSYAIEDGSFLRISNLTLGYTIPENLVKRTKAITNLRVYATVNNLLTITGYSGYDPEANTRRRSSLTPGVDYAAYPRSRFILAGVNVTF